MDTSALLWTHEGFDFAAAAAHRVLVRRLFLRITCRQGIEIEHAGQRLGVRADQIGVADGDAVSMEVSADRLVLRPAKPSYRLADLVRRIRPENRPGETDWGQPAGKEVW